ncbi:MAG: hypothetical protein FWD61_02265 [Phycisphaerales bacterium]|nr:hypothetical protein [Phycisphaerales bacterium]
MHGSNVLVLLGRMRRDWPQPLANLLAKGESGEGELVIEAVASMHEAAVSLVRERRGQTVRGLLIDPAVLTKRDVASLGLVSRRVAMMLLLPVGDVPVEKTREREAMGCGALCWGEAAGVLRSLVGSGADNHVCANEGTFAAKTLTNQASTRYDEVGSERLVSDEELHMLLGN